MSNEELEEYMKTVDPNFNSHVEKGTIEMNNEYYNLMEEKMARLINENQKYKEAIDEAINFIEKNKRHEYRNGNLNEYYLELNEKEMTKLLDILKEVE